MGSCSVREGILKSEKNRQKSTKDRQHRAEWFHSGAHKDFRTIFKGSRPLEGFTFIFFSFVKVHDVISKVITAGAKQTLELE